VVRGRPDQRLLISAGVLARGAVVIGQVTSDGSIEMLDVRPDVDGEWDVLG
jgi:hypothetical protein